MDKILTAALAKVPGIYSVYPLIADETARGKEYIVYERESTTPLNTLDGNAGADIVNYKIHVISGKYASGEALTQRIIQVLESVPMDHPNVQSIDVLERKPEEYIPDLASYRSSISISAFISR